MVELIAAWEPQDDEQRHLQWAQNISQALAPYALKADTSVSDEQEQERVRLASGRTMSDCSILSRNTDDVFRSTIGHLTFASHGKTGYLEHSQYRRFK